MLSSTSYPFLEVLWTMFIFAAWTISAVPGRTAPAHFKLELQCAQLDLVTPPTATVADERRRVPQCSVAP